MNKSSIILSTGIVLIAGFILLFSTANFQPADVSDNNGNITYKNGMQIIDITAKGGFYPANTIAKADTPTTLKITTNGTFDCSATLIIPLLNYEELLPSTGVTEIEVPAQEKGKVLIGLCNSATYSFNIKFE